VKATSPPPSDDIRALAARLGDLALASRVMLATAESCTGGLVAGAITDIAGSSAWFERGFVTYSNRAKMEELGVDPEIIGRHGAVSGETAKVEAWLLEVDIRDLVVDQGLRGLDSLLGGGLSHILILDLAAQPVIGRTHVVGHLLVIRHLCLVRLAPLVIQC